MFDKDSILASYKKIKPYINVTPIVTSDYLNQLLGHKIIFKAECLQVTGAFKVRGVLNTGLTLLDRGLMPKKFVAYSSGNHAKALSWAGANILKTPVELYMHKSTSLSKREAIRSYGAELFITDTRVEAEVRAKNLGNEPGNYFIHPSDNDLVIQGAATLGYEIFSQIEEQVDAVFAACGGGALVSGAYLGAKAAGAKCKIFAGEPEIADDASRSYKLGKIVGFDESPPTIADGLRTLKVSERTFHYLKQLDGFMQATEEEILYWFVWLNHILAIPCEPSSALTMAAAVNWLKLQKKSQTILIILSGGNIDIEVLEQLKLGNYLNILPSL